MKISFLGHGENTADALSGLNISDEVSVSTNPLPYAESFFVLEFVLNGDSLDAAKELADVRDNSLFSGFQLLDDDPSERFERDLFKQIALFERRIRKLLTICLCTQEGHLNVELVNQLEEISLGELFEALFVDEQFNKDVKTAVNQRSSLFEKQELLQELSGINENSLWVKTFSEDEMPTLWESHNKLRSYRNDTMHAHRMTLDMYKDAMRLMRDINEELNDSIQERLNSVCDFGYTQLAENLSKTFKLINESLRENYDFESLIKSMQSMVNAYQLLSKKSEEEGDE